MNARGGVRLTWLAPYWDRGRPARNAPQARSFLQWLGETFSRFALIAGGTPAIPVRAGLAKSQIEGQPQRRKTDD